MLCPQRDELEKLASGAETGPELAELNRHIESCDFCRQVISRLKSDNVLARDLKQAFETNPGVEATVEHRPPDHEMHSVPSDSFDGYTIVREVHRGGQGVVYQAIQKNTKRKVAIKVMREGPFAGPRDRARFEREVQILGALNHRNIVAIHDSGSSRGSFYFVMDYISGQPLDVWMASGQRTIEETLHLFVKICDAVNAAHLRGAIHRDLKPSNIRIDNQGEPRVLDFGLAKMATGQVTDNSQPQVMTVTGQFLGSLPWASPEQAEAMPDKIDIRTDVYSLGVILYQMLTGKFPYDVVGNMRAVVDQIMNAAPFRPSTIRRQINDEVDTIVLKCLSKERERRYQSAGELARDIGHYLNGEPIEAKRDSFGYMLRKQLRRYKLPVVLATVFTFTITGGLIASIALWRHSVYSESAANEARERAEVEAEKSRCILGFLQEMLASADPVQAQGKDVTVRAVLDQAAGSIDSRLREQPATEGAVRYTIGKTYLALGLYRQAEEQLRRSLKTHLELARIDEEAMVWPGKPEEVARLLLEKAGGNRSSAQGMLLPTECLAIADIWFALVQCEPDLSSWDGTEYLSAAVMIYGKLLGNDHPQTLFASSYKPLSDDVIGRLIRFAENSEVDLFEHGDLLEDVLATLRSHWTVGGARDVESYTEDWIRRLRAIPGAEKHVDRTLVALAKNRLNDPKDAAIAEILYRKAVAVSRETHGTTYVGLAARLIDLGDFLMAKEAPPEYEAAQIYREALTIQQMTLDEHSPDVQDTLARLSNLESTLQHEADNILEGSRESFTGLALAVQWAALTQTLTQASALDTLTFSELLILGGQCSKAVENARQTIDKGAKHPCFFKSLGWALLACGKRDEAEASFKLALAYLESWRPTLPLEADPDEWTAAYFLDLVPEQAYTDRWLMDDKFACFPWFYIAQRMEIEGKKEAAIEAYKKSVELGKLPDAHHIRFWSEYRLGVLTGTVKPPTTASAPASPPPTTQP